MYIFQVNVILRIKFGTFLLQLMSSIRYYSNEMETLMRTRFLRFQSIVYVCMCCVRQYSLHLPNGTIILMDYEINEYNSI